MGVTNHEQWMEQALKLARESAAAEEVPVGAIIVKDGQMIGQGRNRCIELSDPTAHAEIMALRSAGENIENYRLEDCDLYTTLEPCVMCAGAIVNARIQNVVIGAWDIKHGAAGSITNLLETPLLNHQCAITSGVLSDESGNLLESFFKKRRA